MQVRIYVINRKKDVERRKRMDAEAKKQNIELEYVEAISGEDLTPEDTARYDAAKLHRYFNYDMIPNEIACVLSHRKALGTFLASDDDYAIILEDDTRFLPHFKEGIRYLTEEMSAWDIVKLGIRDNGKSFPLLLRRRNSIIRPVYAKNIGCGTEGFLYTRHGAAELYKDLSSFYLPADGAIVDAIIRHRLVTIATHPSLIEIVKNIASVIDSPTCSRKVKPRNTCRWSLLYWRHRFYSIKNTIRKIILYIKTLCVISSHPRHEQ